MSATPSQERSRLYRRITRWSAFTLTSAAILTGMITLAFTTFMAYDDEGYVLFSLKLFTEGGGLYERVYTQYGPFFYLFGQLLHFLGFDFTNTGARVLAILCWIGACGFSGALVWRLTRSTVAVVATLGGVYLQLRQMTYEPSHPGGLIALIVAVVAWCGVRWMARPARIALVVGLAGAALLLTKINIGIFLLAGAGAWWVLYLDEPRLPLKWRMVAIAAAMALLPLALMRAQLDVEWVRNFAIVAACAGASVALAAAQGVQPLTKWSDLRPLLAAGVGLALVTCGWILLQGTSVHGLLEGIILGPLRHPFSFTAPFNWRPGTLPATALLLALCVWAFMRPSATSRRVVAIARAVAVLAYLVCWSWDWSLNIFAYSLSFGLAATWLFVLPLDEDRATQPARAWLGLLLVPQALHAYPVAGSQIGWGTFLWMPLAALGLYDAYRVYSPWWRAPQRLIARIVAGTLLVGVTARCAQVAGIGIQRMQDSDALGLAGAENLRLPESFTTMMRTFAQNAAVHADVLFSMPGMHSLHLWTDVPPPTTINATVWFTLLSPERQEAIRAKLEASPRSMIVVQRGVLAFLEKDHITTDTPLSRWIKDNYEPAFVLETYEMWVRKGRKIAALGTAVAREAAGGVTPRYLISITLDEAGLSSVENIELAHFDGDHSAPVASWTNADARVTITPITSVGLATGPAQPTKFPFNAKGIMRLDLYTDKLPQDVDFNHCVLYLRDVNGHRVAEARFVN